MSLTSSFVGVGVEPTVVSASATNGRTVRVVFSEGMTTDAELVDPTNYTITADVGSATRTVSSVTPVGLPPTAVDLTLDGVMTAGTSNYNVAVAAAVTDLAANGVDAAANDADFNGVGASVGQTDAVAVPNEVGCDGGTSVVVTLAAGVTDGNYLAYVGPAGDDTDPEAYSGIVGQRNVVTVTDAVFTCVMPELPVGGPYSVYLVPVDASADAIETVPVVTVYPMQFSSRVFSLRRAFGSRYATGPREPTNVDYPQV